MDKGNLHQTVVNLRESWTYEQIAHELNISRAMVKYIESHPDYKPGKRMAKAMNLDPDPGQLYTKSRIARLNERARLRGYPSFSAVATEFMKDIEVIKEKI